MASERQIAANRANSLKSTGPTSPEGLRKASRNSLRHGMLARTIVLDGESLDRFMLLLSTLQDELQPQTAVESDLVESMAVARWRQMRLWSMEKSALGHEIRKQESATDNSDLSGHDAPTRAALAFRSLSDCSTSLERINRYETRYDRQYYRALDRLMKARENNDFAKRSQFPSTDSTVDD